MGMALDSEGPLISIMVSRPQASGGLLNGLLYVLAEVTQVGWRPNRAQMSGEGDKGDSIEKTARIRQPNYVHVLRHKPTKSNSAENCHLAAFNPSFIDVQTSPFPFHLAVPHSPTIL